MQIALVATVRIDYHSIVTFSSPEIPIQTPFPIINWGAVISGWTVVTSFSETLGEMIHWQTPQAGDQLVEAMKGTMPEHYLQSLTTLLTAHGHAGVAALLKIHRPATKQVESGDWSEVLATETLRNVASPFEIPINRLCWKDCPLSMRGDDILGFDFKIAPFRILKVESKGGSNVTKTVVSQARNQMNNNDGLPSSHSLLFVANILQGSGRDREATAIRTACISESLSPNRIEHAIFLTSGSDTVATHLEQDTKEAVSPIRRRGFFVHVQGYSSCVASTINAVFTTNA